MNKILKILKKKNKKNYKKVKKVKGSKIKPVQYNESIGKQRPLGTKKIY